MPDEIYYHGDQINSLIVDPQTGSTRVVITPIFSREASIPPLSGAELIQRQAIELHIRDEMARRISQTMEEQFRANFINIASFAAAFAARAEPAESKEPITQAKIDRVFGLKNKDDAKERLRSLQRHAMEIRDRMCRQGRSIKEINDWLRSMNFPV